MSLKLKKNTLGKNGENLLGWFLKANIAESQQTERKKSLLWNFNCAQKRFMHKPYITHNER